MKKKLIILISLTVLLGFISCGTTGSANPEWAGVYTGLIPAASTSGIDVEMTLNSDNTYRVIYRYADRGNQEFVFIGDFKWNGSVITLNTKEIPPHYKVEKDFLIQLDLEGKTISGALANNYILKKQ